MNTQIMLKNYLPKTIKEESTDDTPHYELTIVEPAVNVPKGYEEYTNWGEAVSLSVKYRETGLWQSHIIIEDIVAECRPRILDEAVALTNYEIILGIPETIYDWIGQEAYPIRDNKPFYDVNSIIYRREGYVWLKESALPKNAGKNNTLCHVYKDKSKQTEPLGTLKDAFNRLKSNLIGYGQVTIFITEDDFFEFFLTGFQLVNTTSIQSFQKPEIEVSLPDSIITALEKLSLQ